MPLRLQREFTDETLENAPVKATELLGAIAAVSEIRVIMEDAGMSDEQIEEGKALLMKAISTPAPAPAVSDTPTAKAARAAAAELNNYDEPNLPVIGAALARHYPSAAEYVLNDVSPSPVASEALGVIATVLARLNHLENGTDPSRASTATEDKNAIELLASRGYAKVERDRLQTLVDLALGAKAQPGQPVPAAPAPVDPNARRAALLELKLWVNEWSTVAHADQEEGVADPDGVGVAQGAEEEDGVGPLGSCTASEPWRRLPNPGRTLRLRCEGLRVRKYAWLVTVLGFRGRRFVVRRRNRLNFSTSEAPAMSSELRVGVVGVPRAVGRRMTAEDAGWARRRSFIAARPPIVWAPLCLRLREIAESIDAERVEQGKRGLPRVGTTPDWEKDSQM